MRLLQSHTKLVRSTLHALHAQGELSQPTAGLLQLVISDVSLCVPSATLQKGRSFGGLRGDGSERQRRLPLELVC